MADRDTCAGPHPRYKVALIGEPGVGKTSLLTRLKRGTFETTNTSTVGLDTVLLEVTTRSGTLVHVTIYDTAGAERFRSLPRNYYRDKDAIILVYDLDLKYTLQGLHEWIDTVEHCVDPDSVRVWALFGNKSDLDWNVEESDLNSFASRAHLFFKVSAKTGDNVRNAFDEVAELLHEKMTATPAASPAPPRPPAEREGPKRLENRKSFKSNRISC